MEAPATRSGPDPGKRRGLTILAVVAFAGAGLLAFAGLRAGGGDDSVLYADDVVASVVPPTVPPVVTTTPPVTDPPAPETIEPALTASTIPAATTTTAPPPRATPVGLQISTIDVSGYPVRSVGLQENGQLEIPDETHGARSAPMPLARPPTSLRPTCGQAAHRPARTRASTASSCEPRRANGSSTQRSSPVI